MTHEGSAGPGLAEVLKRAIARASEGCEGETDECCCAKGSNVAVERWCDPCLISGCFQSALRAATAPQDGQLGKIREHLIRLSKGVVRPAEYGIQVLRRDREDGSIEYQVFADTKGNGRQIAWVQSSRHDAEFIAACIAQAALFPDLLAVPVAPQVAQEGQP